MSAGDSGVFMHMRKNGASISDSEHWSIYSGPSGKMSEQGGRTIIIHLARGDTLKLYCDDRSSAIHRTTFCVSLSQYDVV